GSSVCVATSPCNMTNACARRAIPAVSRSSSRPRPGPPGAKVENRRRRGVPTSASPVPDSRPTPKRVRRATLFRLGFYDSALNPDGAGVGPVFRAEPGEDVVDPPLDGLFRDRELRGDLLIGIPCSDQPEYLDFRRRQSLVGGVFGQLEGGLRRQRLP